VVSQVAIGIGEWNVIAWRDPPGSLSAYLDHASLREDFNDPGGDGDGYLFVGVAAPGDEWPSLVVTQSFSPAGEGFTPGVLVVPESERVFIGAGSRLLCYTRTALRRWERQWRNDDLRWFWGWRQHGDLVVMSAETELSAWTTLGEPLWTTWVEPPWTYDINGDVLRLDVAGRATEFPARSGPSPG
jgi:hypothetical protein